ncbi:MAG: transketolase [Hyphomicrobiales bacterium]|nr:transketolase [Hyphomicrobiales bacterium]
MTADDLHKGMVNAIRALSIDGVEAAKSGHPGLPMGTAEIATALFTRFLKFDASTPHWPDRDRFILSAGHGSMLLYSLFYLTGYPDISIEDLKHFRQVGSKTPGHPEHGHTLAGVETTTGPLGQGIGASVGFALAERILAAEFGDELVDHRTYVLCSDGDLMEGISQEAIAIAGHLKLHKLIAFYDDNSITIDGPTSLSDSVDQVARFKACGWNASHIDGLDGEAVARAITAAQASDRPTLIACKTIIGYGAPTKAGTNKAHGEPLGPEEAAGAKKNLGWTSPPFEVPKEILDAWRKIGARGASARKDWEGRLKSADAKKRAEFERRLAAKPLPDLQQAFEALKRKFASEKPTIATRKSSEATLDAIVEHVPELVLGSADLTPSNNTKVKPLQDITPQNFSGRYMHYGIREHGMVAAMNGLALHGGIIPAGGTFLVFSDYCRPAIRIAAISEAHAIYVFTHDSIGLGEDGPTHQPVEHLAALRAIPNLLVLRPADAIETAECWQIALGHKSGPVLLALTRQNLKPARADAGKENLCAQGAYEIAPAEGAAKISLFASGSEVELALEARDLLKAKGHAVRVVSVPCFELFFARDEASRRRVIGDAPVLVAVEAAVRQGWDAIIGRDGAFIGMHGYGASGKYKDVYKHFGITAEKVAEAALEKLAAGR